MTPPSDQTTRYRYPNRIRLTPKAEQYLSQLAIDLITGHLELYQLSPALLDFHTFAWEQGRQSRQWEIDALNYTADRLYREMCRRPPARPPISHDQPSYADLERFRGHPERAAEIDETNAARFGATG